MLHSRFFRRLFLTYFALCAVVALGLGTMAVFYLQDAHMASRERTLLDESRLIYRLIQSDLAANRLVNVREQLRAAAAWIGARITLIADDGVVLADTEADAATMANHLLRPEVIGARARGTGREVHLSQTLGKEMLYLATYTKTENGPAYFLRLALPTEFLRQSLSDLDFRVWLAVGLALVFSALICGMLAWRQAAPVAELSGMAAKLAQGELTQRTHPPRHGELAVLGRALNVLGSSLAQAGSQAAQNAELLVTVLGSMRDGVIATDMQQHVLLANTAAGKLLDFPADQSAGKTLVELVREEVVLKAATAVLATGKGAVVPCGPLQGRNIEISLTPLRGSAGLLLVARDATQAIQYQELRKEFVANVSHELRTPLTFIKGFVETLQDGALQDPVKGPEYLNTIEKHVRQLVNLVDDLLEISRLESRPGLPHCVAVNLSEKIKKVVDLLSPAAHKKSQTLSVALPVELPSVPGDPDYLERAISNLVDNAIKYTPPQGTIHLAASASDGQVRLEVSDTGIGIPAGELARIFERFYRVDKSRSREMGGTGLGLAIVKHVVQAHGGTVSVTSQPGKGSTFTIELPV